MYFTKLIIKKFINYEKQEGKSFFQQEKSKTLKSFYKLLKKGNQFRLVLIGIPGHGFKEISKTVKLLGISKNVIFLGYVPHEDLIKFYNAEDLFVFPSLYEDLVCLR